MDVYFSLLCNSYEMRPVLHDDSRIQLFALLTLQAMSLTAR